MKIVAVHNRYQQRGGEDEVCEAEARLLAEHGCTVKSIGAPASDPRNFKEKIDVAVNCVWSSTSYQQMRAVLRDEQPDVVHVHNFFPVFSPSIYYACKEANVPVVQTLHNYRLICPAASLYRDGHVCEECLEHGPWRGALHACYKGSHLGAAALALMIQTHRARRTWTDMVDRYIALTEFSRQKMILGGLPADKIVVKPNFVLDDPGPRAGEGDYALFVGRLADLKGIPVLLEAWRHLSSPVPLVIAGDGPFRKEMEQIIEHHQLKNVHYRGRLSRSDTTQAMKNARFLVFPSTWYEGFPVTIAEAFACGLPVICSRLGSMQEIVCDGRTGMHFEAGNAEDLARTVAFAWEHPERTTAMGHLARNEFEARYTPERNYEMLMEIYEKVTNVCVCA
jgi:glycosyltransferase involved in cell wall biosynthesis